MTLRCETVDLGGIDLAPSSMSRASEFTSDLLNDNHDDCHSDAAGCASSTPTRDSSSSSSTSGVSFVRSFNFQLTWLTANIRWLYYVVMWTLFDHDRWVMGTWFVGAR